MLSEITEAEVIIDTLSQIRKEIASTLTVAGSVFKHCACKEIQNVMMDLESADQHLAGLIENGPTAPYAEVEMVTSEEAPSWA